MQRTTTIIAFITGATFADSKPTPIFPDALSPKEAHEFLYHLKELLDDE